MNNQTFDLDTADGVKQLTNMAEILPIYKRYVKEYLDSVGIGNDMMIGVTLTDEFIKTCEKRIIDGSRIYGDDWKEKDNVKEIKAEECDIFNYAILNKCQEEYNAGRK